jgi:hypothetical protein
MVRMLMVAGPGWWMVVSPGFFDPVVVVSGAFDRAGAGSVPSSWVGFAVDLGDHVG